LGYGELVIGTGAASIRSPIAGLAADSADPAAAGRLITAALTRFGRLD
jgi:hypothetical protein